jgi:membrane peptidoglycan carboxypeptidase
VVRQARASRTVSLDLTTEQIAGLRQAMVAVVEEGTAGGSRLANLTIAGKTSTAQNPHGPDHGWFIGFGPANKPEIVVGAIIESYRHGARVAPLVARTIAHYLGVDESIAARLRVSLPSDSAPEPFQLPVLIPLESIRPILPPPPRDTLDTLHVVPFPPAR